MTSYRSPYQSGSGIGISSVIAYINNNPGSIQPAVSADIPNSYANYAYTGQSSGTGYSLWTQTIQKGDWSIKAGAAEITVGTTGIYSVNISVSGGSNDANTPGLYKLTKNSTIVLKAIEGKGQLDGITTWYAQAIISLTKGDSIIVASGNTYSGTTGTIFPLGNMSFQQIA